MSTAPLRTCGQPGCSTLVPRGRCEAHARPAWSGTQPAPARIRGRKLERLRNQLFNQQPLCVRCQAEGRVTIAVIRDHIVPLTEGGLDVEVNTQGLCGPCSDAKTQAESARGVLRSR